MFADRAPGCLQDCLRCDTLPFAMATSKTKTIATRVPVETAEALAADAAEIGTTPGGLVRDIVIARYARKHAVHSSDGTARKMNTNGTADDLAFAEDAAGVA